MIPSFGANMVRQCDDAQRKVAVWQARVDNPTWTDRTLYPNRASKLAQWQSKADEFCDLAEEQRSRYDGLLESGASAGPKVPPFLLLGAVLGGSALALWLLTRPR